MSESIMLVSCIAAGTFAGRAAYSVAVKAAKALRNRLSQYIWYIKNTAGMRKEKRAMKAARSLFDEKYYLRCHPDVQKSGMDAFTHYMTYGYKMLYNPSATFYGDLYYEMYGDLKAALCNPLLHWVRYGKNEGRTSPIIKEFPPAPQNDGQYEILLVSHELSLTGAPRALFNMAVALKEQHRRFLFLSPSHGDMEGELQKANIDYVVCESLLARLVTGEGGMQKFFASFKIVLFNTIVSLRYAPYIASSNRKICWVHEAQAGYDSMKRNIDIDKAFEKIDRVYSVGKYSASFTNKYCPLSKSDILLYGIPNCAMEKSSALGALRFGIFGSVCKRKGQDLFVDAVLKLPAVVRAQCEFYVVGLPLDKRFTQDITRRAEGSGIKFYGQMEHEKMLRLMNKMDVIACPSQDDPMPIVCTEAAMLGKAVICSDKTGTASFIKDGANGYLYRLDSDDLSEVIMTAFRGKGALEEMGRQWHKVYEENFTEEAFKKNVRRIFHE